MKYEDIDRVIALEQEVKRLREVLRQAKVAGKVELAIRTIRIPGISTDFPPADTPLTRTEIIACVEAGITARIDRLIDLGVEVNERI